MLVMNPGNDGERLSRSQRNPQSGHRRLNERSKSHVQDSVRRARNAERMRRWRCSRQANETLQDAALRRAQHAEKVRNWRLSRRANETPQVAAPRRAQQTAQVRTLRATRRHFVPNNKTFAEYEAVDQS